MTGRDPSVNQSIWLETSDNRQQRPYRSSVLDITDDQIVVAMPSERAQWVLLDKGTELAVLYEAEDCMCMVPAVVRSRDLDPPASLTLERTGSVQRIQRRDFVRMDTSLPVRYQKQSSKPRAGSNLRVATSTQTTRTRDLSGGGAQLVVDEEIKAGELLEMEFVLGQLTVKTLAKVVRFQRAPEDTEDFGYIGVQFMDITESLRDKIIRFIFQEQMRRRREGRE